MDKLPTVSKLSCTLPRLSPTLGHRALFTPNKLFPQLSPQKLGVISYGGFVFWVESSKLHHEMNQPSLSPGSNFCTAIFCFGFLHQFRLFFILQGPGLGCPKHDQENGIPISMSPFRHEGLLPHQVLDIASLIIFALKGRRSI